MLVIMTTPSTELSLKPPPRLSPRLRLKIGKTVKKVTRIRLGLGPRLRLRLMVKTVTVTERRLRLTARLMAKALTGLLSRPPSRASTGSTNMHVCIRLRLAIKILVKAVA
jgi:hypothetical protein